MSGSGQKNGARMRKEKVLVQSWVASDIHKVLAELAQEVDMPMAAYVRQVLREHVQSSQQRQLPLEGKKR